MEIKTAQIKKNLGNLLKKAISRGARGPQKTAAQKHEKKKKFAPPPPTEIKRKPFETSPFLNFSPPFEKTEKVKNGPPGKINKQYPKPKQQGAQTSPKKTGLPPNAQQKAKNKGGVPQTEKKSPYISFQKIWGPTNLGKCVFKGAGIWEKKQNKIKLKNPRPRKNKPKKKNKTKTQTKLAPN